MRNYILGLTMIFIATANTNASSSTLKHNNGTYESEIVIISDTSRTSILQNGLIAIKNTDKKELTFHEKRAIRKETKDIKGELKQEGLMLTLGLTVVIAILLLIILKPF